MSWWEEWKKGAAAAVDSKDPNRTKLSVVVIAPLSATVQRSLLRCLWQHCERDRDLTVVVVVVVVVAVVVAMPLAMVVKKILQLLVGGWW
jgi:hypothetical protein